MNSPPILVGILVGLNRMFTGANRALDFDPWPYGDCGSRIFTSCKKKKGAFLCPCPYKLGDGSITARSYVHVQQQSWSRMYLFRWLFAEALLPTASCVNCQPSRWQIVSHKVGLAIHYLTLSELSSAMQRYDLPLLAFFIQKY